MIRDTSKEAYFNRIATGQHESETDRILAHCNMPVTRRMISHALGLDTATVSGIVTPLVREGKLIELPEKSPCEVTGRNAFWVVRPTEQGDLFH